MPFYTGLTHDLYIDQPVHCWTSRPSWAGYRANQHNNVNLDYAVSCTFSCWISHTFFFVLTSGYRAAGQIIISIYLENIDN